MNRDIIELYKWLVWDHGFIRNNKLIVPWNGGTSIDYIQIVKKYGIK